MRRLYRSIPVPEAGAGTASEVGGHLIDGGSLDAGFTSPVLWNQQQLGNGHKSSRSTDASGALLGWTRLPPRLWSSVLAGHGGKMGSPAWPVGRVWDGLNALGGYKRLRYRFRCAVGVYSGDTLTWGPVSFGLRNGPNGLGVSSAITGIEFFVGERTGDGSLFPNPGLENGWKFAYRYTDGGSRVENISFLGRSQGMHFVEMVYVDADDPVLRARFDDIVLEWDGSAFDPSDPSTTSTYGPAIEGRAVTACPVLEIDELEDGEDPFADERTPKQIVTSTGITIATTSDTPLVTAGAA